MNDITHFLLYRSKCNILTFDRAVNQETGASGRGCRRCHLDLWTGWVRCTCDTHGKQVDVKQLYNPVLQTVWVSWSQLVGVQLVGVSCSLSSSCSSRQWEPASDRGLATLSDPRLSSPVFDNLSSFSFFFFFHFQSVVRWNSEIY